MSYTNRHASRPRPGPDWVVQDVRSYTDWCAGVDECAACGVDVDLDDHHYGVELLRQRPTRGKLGLERVRLVFCTRSCVDAWADTRE
jgi:hypothetical protein